MQPLGRTPLLRRDPAPSRWAYRMQRLWLTPLFRVLFRVGLPAFVLAMTVGIYLSDEARRSAFVENLGTLGQEFQDRPEFQVTLVAVEGASPELADAVRARLALDLPKSSFDLDLDGARTRIEELDAVAKVELRVRSGGILQVKVTQREPALVWRTKSGIEMLDATGHRVASLAARADRPDLPLIAGEGADRVTPEALALIEAAGPLLPRLRGLVRISDRRWDVVLDRDQRLMLPAEGPVAALERILALDKAEDLLARDLLAIDLRDAARPVLRLSPDAFAALHGVQGDTVSSDETAESKL